MLISIDAYHWWPKRVAFRNDYCFTCKQERRAVRVRTFDVGCFLGIPVLPVGFWKHWLCSHCGKDPHAYRGTSSSSKWIAVVLLVLVGVFFLVEPGVPWGARLSVSMVALALVLYLLRSPTEVALKERLAVVPAAIDTTCPFCSAPMISGTQWVCSACGVVRC